MHALISLHVMHVEDLARMIVVQVQVQKQLTVIDN